MALEISTDDFWKELDQKVIDGRTERKLFIEEIEQLCQRVAELERGLDSAYQLADHYRDERDALIKKRDELLAALVDIQQVACSGSPELGIASDAIASIKEK